VSTSDINIELKVKALHLLVIDTGFIEEKISKLQTEFKVFWTSLTWLKLFMVAKRDCTSVLWRSQNLFCQILVTFKEVIWHKMLTLKNKGLGKVAPSRVEVGDGTLVR